MDMLALDFIGLISPLRLNRERYILIIIDYFSRYLFVRPTITIKGYEVLNIVKEDVFLHFRILRAFYNDNAKAFIKGVFRKVMEKRGVIMINPPPRKPSAISLAKAYVKLVKKGL